MLPKLPGGLGQRIELAAELYRAWDAIAGPELAQRGSPVGIERGCLLIAVSEPVWMQEISMLGPEIVERFTQQAPEFRIASIRCVYAEATAPQPAQRLSYHTARRLRQQMEQGSAE